MTNQLERQAAEDLAAAGTALSVDTTTQVRSGPPGDVICELADEGSFDLIIVVSHGSGFLKTVLSDQDGFARMFSETTRLLAPRRLRAVTDARLRRWWVLGPLAAAPIALYLAVGEPVGLLKLAGLIEAIHLPVVAGVALLLGCRMSCGPAGGPCSPPCLPRPSSPGSPPSMSSRS